MTGTMAPDEFHEQLARELADGPSDHDLRTPVARDLARGHRLLRRRRYAAVGAAAVLVVAGAGVALARPASTDRASGDGLTAAERLRTDQDLLRACREGNQAPADTEAIFGSGAPSVEVAERTTYQVLLALQSADGNYWADCFVSLTESEFRSGIQAHSTTGSTPDFSYGSGPGCGLVDGRADTDCDTFEVSYVDRRPAEVASVEVVLGNGETVRRRTHDGFVVLNYLGSLPDGMALTARGHLHRAFKPIRRITFLDRTGTPIAAEAMDGSGAGIDHDEVDGLPTLRAFPSLSGGSPSDP